MISLLPHGHFARRRMVVGTLACLGLAVSLAAAPRWRGPIAQSFMRGFSAEPLATATLRPSERTFLEKAASLSGEKLRMARLAVSQANSSEVRDFAQQLATDHQSMSNTLADLQRRKGAATPPASDTKAESPDVVSESFQRLAGKTGADFDREFVRIFTEAHTQLLNLVEQATSDAKDVDVREFAGAVLPTLRDHQNRLTELRKVFE